MIGHITVLKQRPLNRKPGWTTAFVTPEGLGYNELTTRHTCLKEDCGHNDPLMSPGSRLGRGAIALTPAPNGAKVFYITHRTRCIAKAMEGWPKEKKSFSREGIKHGA